MKISISEQNCLLASSKGTLAFPVTFAGSHFCNIRFEDPPAKQDQFESLHKCTINNNTGPDIDLPTPHQNPGFRSPHRARPVPDPGVVKVRGNSGAVMLPSRQRVGFSMGGIVKMVVFRIANQS